MTRLEDTVQDAVEKLIDPETGFTFGQMKLIKGLREIEPGIVKIEFVPSSPFCPIAFKLAMDVKKAAESVEGVKKAFVYCNRHVMKEAINRMVNQEEEGK